MSNQTKNNYFVIENGIEKSVSDDRRYDYFQLPNGLRVVTVTDQHTDKACVSMSVGVGTLDDPSDVAGLAHFVEHLLFMGTKKHPTENAYNVFLSHNSGTSNAYTGNQNTHFYFDVDNSALFETLDLFSGFFTCPLFLEESVQREIQAVDNEHSKNLQSDLWRTHRLVESLSVASHPLNHFGTGNKETLSLTDIRDRAIAFHDCHYSAGNMQLVVLSAWDPQNIRQHIEMLFKEMNSDVVKKEELSDVVFENSVLGSMYYVVPVGDLKSICLYFPLPSQLHDTVRNSEYLLSSLIGHEGEGSILQLLRDENLATALSAGRCDELSFMSLFKLSISLTDFGLTAYDRVLQIVFSYMTLLDNEEQMRELYEEDGEIHNADFRFMSKSNSSYYVDHIVSRMSMVPLRHILNGEPFSCFDFQHILSLVSRFQPNNCIAFLSSKSSDMRQYAVDKEVIYGTEYGLMPRRLDSIVEERKTDVSKLHLPAVNPFICTDFTMENGVDATVDPVLLIDTDRVKLWHSCCTQFCLPKCYLSVLLNSGVITESVESTVCAYLMLRSFVCYHIIYSVVERQVITSLYPASIASYKYSFSLSFERGLLLSVRGFDEKMELVVKTLFDALQNISVTESEYEDEYNKFVDNLQTMSLREPYSLIYSKVLSLLLPYPFPYISWGYSIEERLDCIKNTTISLSHVKEFAYRLIQSCRCEWLIVGNMTAEDATHLVEDIENPIDEKRLSWIPGTMQIRSLLHECVWVRELVANPNSVNCASLINWQIPVNLSAATRLFSYCSKEYLFHTLRTQKQLGYIVWSFFSDIGGSCNFIVIVQSNSFTCKEISLEINDCIADYRSVLKEMENEKFEILKSSLCAELTQKIFTVGKLKKLFWPAIADGHFDFRKKATTAKEIESITKENLLAFYDNFIVGPYRSTLSFEYGKQSGNDYSDVPESGKLMTTQQIKECKTFLPKQWKEYDEI